MEPFAVGANLNDTCFTRPCYLHRGRSWSGMHWNTQEERRNK